MTLSNAGMVAAKASPDASHQAGDRPLATLVLVAYNQEKYIGEAVASALAQTYSPLEIILSDDCSSDETFAIMQAMAAAYSGPHQVRAVRTPANLGLIQHVLLRGREAAGEIVVLAAGDDVSFAQRVEVLVKAFTPRTGAAYSLCDQIDENGVLMKAGTERGIRPPSFDAHFARAMSLREPKGEIRITQGSTAAYRSQLFQVPVNGDRKRYSEEMLLCFFAHMQGYTVDLVNESLVAYRQRPGALANFTEGEREARSRLPESEQRFSRRSNIEMYFDFHEIALRHDQHGRIDGRALYRNLREEEIKFFWIDMGIVQKISSVFSAGFEGNWSLAAWCLSRLLGVYQLLKSRARR